MDPQQPINTLAQMLAEVAAMSRDQVVLSRQQLAALQSQAERQTMLMEAMGQCRRPPRSPDWRSIKWRHRTIQATAAACGWLVAEWAVRLLPLLSGDAQTAALGLPAPSRGQYGEIKRAVLDRLGLSAEDHRRRFRGSKLGPADRPFVFAQQLKDAATRWLQPGGSASEGRMLEKIVLEQFVEGLPAATSDWVLCHRPADLAGAITLAEDHLAVLSRGRAHDSRPASPGGPTPAPRGGPAVQPLQAWLLTHRGLLRRQGRSAGGADNSDTSEVSAPSWRWAKCSGLPALQHPPPVQGGRTAFRLVGQCAGVRSRPTGTGDTCAVLSGDARSSDTADGEGEPAGPSQEAPQVPVFDSMEDFPLEQSQRDELGPEVPKSTNPASLLCGDQLSPSQRADIDGLQ
ncbi:Neurotrophin receptor-interacting factor [Merluccius polli]|uniref:Neurotrophin receptor-interacting factor n=1 Tax=Merluccius polli TaxID=89951 RepID=A0AA47LZR1_MERPO|nr:Neurotrophin receptor-interacting factor [Merluccius polli]